MFSWLTKIISRIAEEVHKSKIEDFDSKMAELISDHKVMLKTIKENEDKIKNLEKELKKTSIVSAKIEATIRTVLLLKDKDLDYLKPNNDE